MRKYEVEMQIVKSEIYHIEAKDEADLIEKNKGGFIETEGKLIRTDKAENTMGGWKLINNNREGVKWKTIMDIKKYKRHHNLKNKERYKLLRKKWYEKKKKELAEIRKKYVDF